MVLAKRHEVPAHEPRTLGVQPSIRVVTIVIFAPDPGVMMLDVAPCPDGVLFQTALSTSSQTMLTTKVTWIHLPPLARSVPEMSLLLQGLLWAIALWDRSQGGFPLADKPSDFVVSV